MTEYKKYTAQAKAAIKGEAFFESIVSDYSIPHHISEPKDIGIDYFCEWVYGDKPSGILYAVQIKTLAERNVKIESLGINTGLNELTKFDIKNQLLHIDANTLEYWRGLGIPVYLFAVIYSDSSVESMKIDCYYKRFTQLLTTTTDQEDEYFYKVNDGATIDYCPKIINLPRADCAIGFAGTTGRAYALIHQLTNAISAFGPLESRAMDIRELRTHAIKIFSTIVNSIDAPIKDLENPDVAFIFGGYSWILKSFVIWHISYDNNLLKMIARPAEHAITNPEAKNNIYWVNPNGITSF